MTLLRSTAALVLAFGAAFATPAFAQKKYDIGARRHGDQGRSDHPSQWTASAYGSIGKVQAAYIRMINDQGGFERAKDQSHPVQRCL